VWSFDHSAKHVVYHNYSTAADAITVGLTIEDHDIKNLKTLMAETTNANILFVYTGLLNGSYKGI